MNIEINEKKSHKLKTIKIHMKVCDQFSYEMVNDCGHTIHEQEDGYVPSFMPGNHYGDYLILDIDAESGLITNWNKNKPELFQ